MSFEQGTDFSAMTPPGANGWITCRAKGKTLHQRRIVPTRSRGSGSYTFFKIEMQTEEGETVCISGQLVASFHYRWSADAEPVLKALLRNMTYQKNGAPSLDQNE